MQLQTNPYLIWQLIPAGITAWLAILIHRKRTRKTELTLLEVMMFAAAFWSLVNAIQFLNPDASWQGFFHKASFLAILIIPTAWFLMSVHYSHYLLKQVRRFQWLFVIMPVLSLLAVLSNEYHHLFFTNSYMVSTNGFSLLVQTPGPLFTIHTWYSYALVLLGMLFLGLILFRKFRKMGVQAIGLALGITVPAVVNFLYLRDVFLPGFPDPTPISFTITGIIFAWVLFSSRMLEVVPIAHGDIVSNLSLGILVLDNENKVLQTNLAACRMLGIKKDHLQDQPLAEILKGDLSLLLTLQQALEAGSGQEQLIVVFPRGGDQAFEVSISPILDEHDGIQSSILQITDISQRKEIEKNLAESHHVLDTILDTLQDYYFETDVAGYVVNINKAFYTHLGYSTKEELVGKHFRHFTDRQSIRSIYQNFKKLYETRETLSLFRYQYRTKDGRSYIGETTISPIIEKDVVVGSRGVLRNVTDQVIAEEHLHLAKKEAENHVRELTAINRIASISTRSLKLDKILQSLCFELTTIFSVSNARICLVSEDLHSMQLAAFHSIEPGETGMIGKALPLKGHAAREEAINKGRTVVVYELPVEYAGSLVEDSVSRDDGRVTMTVPLKTRRRNIGTIIMSVRDPAATFDENEISLAETIAYQAAAAIENAQLYKKTETELGVVEHDLDIGRQVQSGFFPESIPVIEGWEFAAHFEPSRQVAGDFYDFFQFEKSNMMAVIIADVCDKGVGAALFMVLFRSLLRAFSRVEVNGDNAGEQLKKIISKTNDYIAEIHGESNMFATIFMGILDSDTGDLHYVNGGHEPPVILNKKGKIVRNLQPTGPAVGVFPQADFRVEQIALQMGDFLMGYTDGTTDARNEKEEIFSKERLMNYIQYPWSSLFSMVFEVKNELKKFAGPLQQFDDITIISMRRKISNEQEVFAICRDASLKYLPELGAFVEDSVLFNQLPRQEALILRNAAEQACDTIMRSGYPAHKSGVLSINLEKMDNRVRLIIRDDGRSISFSQGFFEAQKAVLPADEFENGSPPMRVPVQIISYEDMNGSGNQLILEKEIILPEPEETISWNGWQQS